MAEILVSLAAKAAELLVEPTISQFRYMFGFNNLARDFKQKEEDLTSRQNRVQNAVTKARNNSEMIEKDVEEWQKDADAAIGNAKCLKDEIDKDKRWLGKRCPNWIWRYRLSRRMAKETKNLVELKKKGEFQQVSHPDTSDLPSLEFSSEDFILSKSRKSAFKRIMEALKDDGVNRIAVCGMGGVGKTTLVKEVAKIAQETKLFDEVVMAVVSQTPDVRRIQDQIAEKLGLKLEEKSQHTRANLICRIIKNKQKILLILDDIWERLDLNDIGIPVDNDHNPCKILLTTRRHHVCHSMRCERLIDLHVLNADEAWVLFKKSADVRDDDSPVAKAIATECKGLPIAIVTVGRALRGKTGVQWDVALQQLQNAKLTDIEDIDDRNAYACLKLSYDHLRHRDNKLCFLLCALFPEDYEIPIETLTLYAIGVGACQDVDRIHDARQQVLAAIESLKASCMLLKTRHEATVKMHDLVRDFAHWIGSKTESVLMMKALQEWPTNQCYVNFEAISFSTNITQFPNGLVGSKLKMLLLSRCRNDDFIQFPETSFKGMNELRVLSIDGGSLSMQVLVCLTDLQMLELKNCSIANLAALGKLKQLQILKLSTCDITEIPDHEMEGLQNLRLLGLEACEQLPSFFSSILPRLSKLEVLDIKFGTSVAGGIFEFDGENNNKDLRDKELMLSRLTELNLTFSDGLKSIWKGSTRYVSLQKLVILSICLCESVSYIFSPSLARGLVCLQTLSVKYCPQLKYIIAEKDEEETVSNAHSQPLSLALQNLKSLTVVGCGRLEYAFPMSVVYQGSLLCLEEIMIRGCEKLKRIIFGIGEEEQGGGALFGDGDMHSHPRNTMQLIGYLHQEGNFLVLLPSLQRICVQACPELKMHSLAKTTVPSKSMKSTNLEQLGHGEPHSIPLKWIDLFACHNLRHMFADDQISLTNPWKLVCFTNLSRVEVATCHRLKSLCPVTLAQCLPQLQELRVSDCNELLEVFASTDEAEINDKKEIVFPRLSKLELQGLRSLISFCPSGYHFIFPSLEQLTVERCYKRKTRFSIALSTGCIHVETVATTIVRGDPPIEPERTQEIIEHRAADQAWRKNIKWRRQPQHKDEEDALPPYVEDEAKASQVVEDPSGSSSKLTGITKSKPAATKKRNKNVKEGEEPDEKPEPSSPVICCLTRGG